MPNILTPIGQTFTNRPNIAATYGPYASIAAAHAALSDDNLNIIGMTVGIQVDANRIEEYWYQGGTTQAHLVKKQMVEDIPASALAGDIPASKLSSGVQTSLGKADTAYQKPGTGIPASDLASAVQTSLGKADTAVQPADIAALDGNPTGTSADGHVSVQVTEVDGVVNGVNVTTNDIASASALAGEVSRAQGAESALDAAKADKATTLYGYGINDAYTKAEVNNLVSTPHQQYVTLATKADLDAITTGSADTIYRVSNYDGTQVDDTKYAEYAWDGTQFMLLSVKSAVGEVFDVSEYNSGATYGSLDLALAAVPASVQRGGMSIKYINSTSGQYDQYRLMSATWSIAVSDWQGVDEAPTPGSKNLVESGGVFASAPYQIFSENANERYSYVPVKIKQGHTYRIKKTPNYSYNDANCVLYFRVYKTNSTDQKLITLTPNQEYIDVTADRDYNWLVFDNVSQTVGHTKEIYFFDVDELLQKTIVEKTKFSTNESLNDVGIDNEIISGSNNLLTGDAVFDVACKTTLSIDTNNVYQAIFKQGKTYIIVNIGTTTTPNLSTRATSSGATIDSIGSIAKGNQTEFTASEDANYLRCGAGGAATTVEIFEKDQIQHKLFSDEKRITTLESNTQANTAILSELSDNYVKTLVFDKLLTDDYVLGKSINTNVAVGETVNIIPSDSSSFAYIIVPCKQGDVFVLSGVGGTNPKLYCFTDAEYIKTQDGSVNSGTNIFITAPNDGYFISNVNYKHSNGYSLGVVYISNDAETIEKKVGAAYAKCTDVDNVPTENSEKFVKSGGVFNVFNEPYDEAVELTNSVSGKYIGSACSILDANGSTIFYFSCSKGDKFKLSYSNNGPSQSAARMYAVYSVDDISEAGSDNDVARGDMMTDIVANEEYEIEIVDDEAKLLVIQQVVSGLVNLVPKLITTSYRNEFERIDEELTGHVLEECPFSSLKTEDIVEGNYIVANGNLQSNQLFRCYRFDCEKGDKFFIFTFKALNSDIARYYGIYSSKDTFSSSTKLETGPKFSEFGVGRIDIEITQDTAKSILIGSRDSADIQLFKQKDTSIINVLESDVDNLRYDADKVHFTYDHELKTTNIREVFDLSNAVHEEYWGLTGMNSLMYQIQDKMDELAVSNPNYITKFDAAELVGLEYPEYANGIDTAGTYLVTPAYKTYGYKLAYNSRGVNGLCNRPTRILVTGSVHGNEQSASLNLYTIMKELCEDYLTDINIFKMRAAFEIYIVPCVNGYSSIHRDRKNANGVNINRNFPCNKWDEQGSDDPESSNYRGPYAGSEFETQLVMALINKIKPDMFIDAHNYSTSDPLQFFTEMTDYRTVRLAYDSLADVSFTLKKAYPLWFGTNYAMLKGDSTHNNSGHAPADYDNSTGKSPVYAFDHGVPFAATIEISGGINYNNGELSGHDPYIEDVYQIGEYTFMNQLKRYGEFVANNIVSTRYTDWKVW